MCVEQGAIFGDSTSVALHTAPVRVQNECSGQRGGTQDATHLLHHKIHDCSVTHVTLKVVKYVRYVNEQRGTFG